MQHIISFIAALLIGAAIIGGIEACHRACEICATTPVSLY